MFFPHKKLSTKVVFKNHFKKVFVTNFVISLDKIAGGGIIEVSLIAREKFSTKLFHKRRGNEKAGRNFNKCN